MAPEGLYGLKQAGRNRGKSQLYNSHHTALAGIRYKQPCGALRPPESDLVGPMSNDTRGARDMIGNNYRELIASM